MVRRRTAPPRPPTSPPANAEEGATRIQATPVKMFGRGDGTGANWRLMLESLYRVGFQLTDGRLAGDAKDALMRRVDERAEVRLTGGYADGSRPEDVQPRGTGFRAAGS